ncbi:hypothetical protein Gorai_010588, partial [Gossypium raimondii]|nr:hypothetical protein [Gossypium raimondii]
NETLVLPLSAPIDDDTTLLIDVVHADSEEDTKPLIGSAKFKLHEVPTPPATPLAYGYPYGQLPRNPYYASPPAGYPYSGYNYNVPPPYGQALLSMGNGGYTYYGQEEKKSKFGRMGTRLAVGAVAGALGGLALAKGVDAVEDHIIYEVAKKVEDDLGYDGVGGANDF